MFFAAGASGDPTPERSATMRVSVTPGIAAQITGASDGNDTCEGPFLDGTMRLDRLNPQLL